MPGPIDGLSSAAKCIRGLDETVVLFIIERKKHNTKKMMQVCLREMGSKINVFAGRIEREWMVPLLELSGKTN